MNACRKERRVGWAGEKSSSSEKAPLGCMLRRRSRLFAQLGSERRMGMEERMGSSSSFAGEEGKTPKRIGRMVGGFLNGMGGGGGKGGSKVFFS